MIDNQKVILSVQALAGYPAEIGRWLWTLEETRRRTKRSLEGLDPAVIDWAASPRGNSIGTLLYHILAIEMDWLFVEVLERAEFPPDVEALLPYDVRDAQSQLTRVEGVSLEEHLARLDQGRAIFLTSFCGMSIEEFRRLRSFDNYDVTPEWVIQHLCQHEAEHRGQIQELRTMAEQLLQIQGQNFR
jgi:uncharacterized damage-inducible protein DinB